ncbi:SICA antigen [Plasmodium coatneyi]|uniref:SICA antigen n=1 Tax=Plasmodium coatneyi TaxID=208452 RepID=A0A1B1DTP8_9APIC|nr:SICA antigen [Plasmodium coatneyi]ANQ06143.1 SICA antigen [Plasmodium coatneyi]
MVKMAPRTNEYEQQHPPKVEEEARDDGARSDAPRARRAASKGSESGGEEFLFILKRGQTGVTVKPVSNDESNTQGPHLILTLRKGVLPTDAKNNLTPGTLGPTGTHDQTDTELKTAVAKTKKVKAKYKCPDETIVQGEYDVDNEHEDDKEGLGIEDWFNLFSRDVTKEEEEKLEGWSGFLALCNPPGDDDGSINVDLNEYGKFCKVMVRNIMLVTNPKNQYENKGTKCQKVVKGVSVCDLLKVWAYYMQWLCAPRKVIDYAFHAVKEVREVFKKLNLGGNYAECTYNGVPDIPDDKVKNILPEAYDLFYKSVFYIMMEAITKEKAWCIEGKGKLPQKASEDLDLPRAETEEDNDVVSADDGTNEFKGLLRQVKEGMDQEKEEKAEVLEELKQNIAEPSVPSPQKPSQQEQEQQKEQQQQLQMQDNGCKSDKLCERVTCVGRQYRTDEGGNPDWDKMWGEVKDRVDGLAKVMSKEDRSMNSYCNSHQWTNSKVTFAQRETCKQIVRGLHHIYSTQTDGEKTDSKSKNNQQFYRTMECILLNAYADQLKEKGNYCGITEGEIQKMFNEGNTKKRTWCLDKNCIECKREEKLNCQLNNENIKTKVDGLLNINAEIQGTLKETCKDCSKEENLCERTKCVTINWFRDRLTNGGTGRRDWCNFWGDQDVGKVLKNLSESMIKESSTNDELCNSFTGADDTVPTDPRKKACQYIARGLEYIYSIKEEENQTYANQKKNNRIFDQTVGCLFLNAYVNLLIKKSQGQVCPITEEEIKEMFKKGNGQIDKWCVQKKEDGNGSDCVTCKREPDLNCTLSVEDYLLYKAADTTCEHHKNNIKGKLDDMLVNDKTGLKQTLDDITAICKPKPAAPPPAPAPPPSGSSAAGGGETDDATLKATKAAQISNKIDNPVLPYLPLAPAMLGISIMSYLLWKYFGMQRKTRKRYRRGPQIRGPTLEEQLLAHVDQPGPREYYIVRERKPRSMPKKRRKKRVPGRHRAGRGGGGVRRRMIIDIHLEVLDECQKGDTKLVQEDFFEILVQEFMGSEFIREENVPKEYVPMEEVQSSDFGFMEKDIVPNVDVRMEELREEQIPSSDSGFRV